MLVIGLGNPGAQYKNTRHNIGFIAVEMLSHRYNFLFSHKNKFNADVAEGLIEKYKLFLLKPMTYMNLSGKAVKAICSYYQILPKEIYVIHDDIDLETGRVKVKLGGGNAGHNGLKSIDTHIGPNYHRIRIGVGRDDKVQAADYVLGQISKIEWPQLQLTLDKICDNFDLVVQNKLEEFKMMFK